MKKPVFRLPPGLPRDVVDYVTTLEEIADGDLDVVRQREALAARLREMYEEVTSAVQDLRDMLTVLSINRTQLAAMTLPLQTDLLLLELRDAERRIEARLHQMVRVVQPPK